MTTWASLATTDQSKEGDRQIPSCLEAGFDQTERPQRPGGLAHVAQLPGLHPRLRLPAPSPQEQASIPGNWLVESTANTRGRKGT